MTKKNYITTYKKYQKNITQKQNIKFLTKKIKIHKPYNIQIKL